MRKTDQSFHLRTIENYQPRRSVTGSEDCHRSRGSQPSTWEKAGWTKWTVWKCSVQAPYLAKSSTWV